MVLYRGQRCQVLCCIEVRGARCGVVLRLEVPGVVLYRG